MNVGVGGGVVVGGKADVVIGMDNVKVDVRERENVNLERVSVIVRLSVELRDAVTDTDAEAVLVTESV